METKEFHNKITWFTFIFSLLVIWSHSSTTDLLLEMSMKAKIVGTIEYVLGVLFAQLAVPGYFMISGYLFYRNFTMTKLVDKWRSRLISLVIPYLIWNLLYYLGYVLVGHLPILRDIVGRGTIPLRLDILLDAIINHTYHYVFWYLKQLIILVGLAPVIYLLAYKKSLAFISLLVLWRALSIHCQIPLVNLDALFYYLMAAHVAIHYRKWVEATWNVKRTIIGTVLFGVGIYAYHCFQYQQLIGSLVIYRMLVPVAFWHIVNEKHLIEALKWMKINFWLYASHIPLVRLITKLVAARLSSYLVISLLCYLCVPAVVVFLSYRLALRLQLILPRLWGVLIGHRYDATVFPSGQMHHKEELNDYH